MKFTMEQLNNEKENVSPCPDGLSAVCGQNVSKQQSKTTSLKVRARVPDVLLSAF